MNSIQQVYFCGLGALGGMYASRLCAVPGVDLKIVADLERIQRYQEHGIVVNGSRLRLSFLSPTDTAPIADLVIIGVKWHQLDQALVQIRPFVGPATVILSLLNGIESENVIARTLGVQPLYSFVVETDAGRNGQQIEYRTLGTIVFGEASNVNISPRVAAVRELFDQAAIPYRIPADMLRDLWWKFMLNVGVNPTSAIMKAPYGVFQKNAEARQCVRMACREVLDIARQAGISLAEQDIDAIFPIIDRLSPEKKTSMLQDVEAGRKTEIEMFAGTVVEQGRLHGIATPVNELLLNMVLTIERNYPCPS